MMTKSMMTTSWGEVVCDRCDSLHGSAFEIAVYLIPELRGPGLAELRRIKHTSFVNSSQPRHISNIVKPIEKRLLKGLLTEVLPFLFSRRMEGGRRLNQPYFKPTRNRNSKIYSYTQRFVTDIRP